MVIQLIYTMATSIVNQYTNHKLSLITNEGLWLNFPLPGFSTVVALESRYTSHRF